MAKGELIVARDTEAQWVSIDDLTPWAKNPRRNDHAVAGVADSIARFGWSSPIIARRSDGVIVAGHTRFKAAKQLGLDKVLVRYMDLDPAQAKALALADNKLGEVAVWDDGALEEVLRELLSEGEDIYSLGWGVEAIEKFITDASADDVIREMIEPPEVPYGSGARDASAGAEYDGPDAPPPIDARDVQMVQVFFSAHQHARFLEWCRVAKREDELETVSDIVYHAMEQVFEGRA